MAEDDFSNVVGGPEEIGFKKQQYIAVGTVRMFLEPKNQSTNNCLATQSLYTTKIARISYTMLSIIFKCKEAEHTISAYNKCLH